MKDISPTELTTVTGGTTKTDQITQQLTTLQASLKDIATASNGGGNNNMFMLLAMMMMMRPQPTVVAGGGGGPPFMFAAGPVINVSTRFRRH